jgi:large subunit GTPase 1
LDIWRQLWRVVELSDVVIQIVDARNPEVFYCADLFEYTESIDTSKASLLLLNKADLLTDAQRDAWAAHLRSKGLSFLFFSALADDADAEEDNDSKIAARCTPELSGSQVLSRSELLDYLAGNWGGKTVGLVGYPNVGKSSTINALMGEKKVAVAITPGKTKHYQTLFLGNGVKICDCPGLVFPNFSVSKSDLVLNGILPVDQLKDWISPTTLLSERIPRDIIERLYGIILPLPGFEEDPDRKPTAAEVLSTFAIARGFRTSNYGNPDQSRASRIILKDYVAGKLLFCHAPPGVDQVKFSEMTSEVLRKTLPIRSQPKPHKPSAGIEDEHLLSTSVGFVTKKPGDKAAFSNSKKHFKGKR